MNLLAIKATTRVDQVNLLLSDKSILPFPVDKINTLRLSKGMEISPDFLAQLKLTSIAFVLNNYALRLIAMSPQTSQTISSKLNIYLKRYLYKTKFTLGREQQQTIIEQIISYLQDQKLLNDQEYAKFLVNKYRHKSRQEIAYRLQKAGIAPNSELTDEVDEQESIKKLILKKLKSGQDLSDFNTKNKIIAYLYRKGFPLESVKTVIDSIAKNR